MAYIRHRQRMLQESVFEDLKNTLIACRWVTGTTSRQVINPENDTLETVTTTTNDVFPLVGDGPLVLMDAFPADPSGIKPNVLAVDAGVGGESQSWELGNGALREQPYSFAMALLVENDALGNAVLNDLRDRYEGRLVAPDAIPIFDYLTSDSVVVGYLDIESFRWTPDFEMSTQVARYFNVELTVVDFVE